jgi:hypothetical protein
MDNEMSDTPITDIPLVERLRFQKRYTRGVVPVTMDEAAGRIEQLERENAELADQVMRWFKAASPYATPGSLKAALERYENAVPIAWVHKDAAILKQGKTFHPSLAHEYIPVYAAPQAATGIVPPESSAPADAALTCLCLSFPKACPVHRGGPIDSTVKPSAWD